MNDQDINFSNFEKCKFRSKYKILKKSCCQQSQFNTFACIKRNIYPLSPIRHCFKCKEFQEDS